LTRREAEFDEIEGLEAMLSDEAVLGAIADARAIAAWLTGEGAPLLRLLRTTGARPSLEDSARVLALQNPLAALPAFGRRDRTALSFFTGFAPHHHEVLEGLLRQYHAARKPLVGYAFTRARARQLDEELGARLPVRSALEAHRKLKALLRAGDLLSSLGAGFGKAGIAAAHQHWAYQQVIDGIAPMTASADALLRRVARLRETLAQCPELTEALEIDADDLGWVEAAVSEGVLLARLTEFVAEHRAMRERFVSFPEFDYVGEKSRLESLHTQRLAHTIDGRVVEFANEHRNLARGLRDIIRKRQRFPRDAFEHLKKAFPCMIAGIRDYAE